MAVVKFRKLKRFKLRATWPRTFALCLLTGVGVWSAGNYQNFPASSFQAIQSNPYSVSAPRSHQVQGPSSLIVVDGDTVKAPFGVKYRLVGFDAPETWRPECDAEAELGEKATKRLEELIASGMARIIEKGKGDKYGRTLATLTVNGQDVGGILISEGLARPYKGGKRKSWGR